MAIFNPQQQYLENQVMTASPEELTHLLYKGAVKFISLGIKAIELNKLEEAHKNIIKAQNIYYELASTLDPKYELSKNLASLYEYVLHLLIQGNMKKDKEMLEQALGLTKEFADVWGQAIQIYRKTRGAMPEDQVVV